MDAIFLGLSPVVWAAAICIATLAGFVKGVVGFAMPMILVSGLSSFVPPETALAGLMLPTLVTNLQQTLRSGTQSAVEGVKKFRLFLWAGAVVLVLSAQLVPYIPKTTYLLLLGVPIVLYAISQIMGLVPGAIVQTPRLDVGIGALAGFFGGVSGVWGPPTVSYLTALDTPKKVQVQVQGVVFLSGTIVLLAAHIVSGIVTMATSALSLCLVPPAILGMKVGLKVQDRIDQTTFRRATLVVLMLAGLNLVRRGLA